MSTDITRALEARLLLLEARLAVFENAGAPSGSRTPEVTNQLDRRSLLRKAGAAAAGAVALNAFAQDRAAAADGSAILQGALNTGTLGTKLIAGTDTLGDQSGIALAVQGNNATVIDGVAAVGTNRGLVASGGRLGAALFSNTSHLRMFPGVNPSTSSANLLRGEFRVDTNGDFWYQHTDGAGNAVRIAGPAAAGALVVVDPFRTYDSRSPGILAAGTSRVVPVTTVAGTPVPAGAKAIIATLTLTGTQGTFGFLTITAGDVASTGASSINWFGPDQSLAATVVARLDTTGRVKLFNNSPNATNFILDVTGYYR